MKDITPRQVARNAALVVGAILVALLIVVHLFIVKITLLAAIILVVAILIGSYFAFYAGIELFIHNKIKLIYRTIHSLKSPKAIRGGASVMDKDFLGEINREVQDWADEKIDEIRELRQRDDFRKEFIGNLAHELKTPIFNIQGYILTLIEGALDDPEINHKFLLRASRSVERMTMIVNDLDTISQLESGVLQLKTAKVDIVELVRDVLDNMEMSAKNKKVKLKIGNKFEKSIFVMADRFRIEQVVVNLVSNAINYSKADSTCTVSFFDLDQNVLIEVTDDGPGIAAEHLPRLFERFYRVDKSRAKNAGGTGLGLAIVKHIVEAHGQSINVRSKEGEGSTFSFTLSKA
jgi:two-component system, OmpR family, phosphate regulon sensor histidine kinase PhoR